MPALIIALIALAFVAQMPETESEPAPEPVDCLEMIEPGMPFPEEC